MNVQLQCPKDSELSDLLDGNLVDPQMSELAEHLENCSLCQRKVGSLTSHDTLAIALRGKSIAIDTIANEIPRQLVERVKQIPMLASDHSVSGHSGDTLSRLNSESIVFSSDTTPGTLGVLGHYRILNLLGSGGMGSVFLAQDTKLHRHVALKVMLPRIAADPTAKQRFLREARAAASLKSDHIVTVHQVHEENDVPYLAMEYLQGYSLEEAIWSQQELSLETIIHVAYGVSRGLADAHEKGMVHRDIKPANIWLEHNEDGPPRVKILDFGLAQIDVDDTHLTHANSIIGTPAFMAPEQARGDKSADTRSDLFSLGCVIYYMCTGEVPFKAESTMGTLMALAVNTPDAPSDRNAAIPLRLSDLTMKLLEKDPINRPQTARGVARELSEIQNEIDLKVADFATPGSQTLPATKFHRGHITSVAAIVGLLAILGFCLLAFWPKQPLQKIANAELDQAQGQQRRFSDEFKIGNPNFDGTIQPAVQSGEIVGLTITGNHITNLEALGSLNKLTSLSIEGVNPREFRTLEVSGIQRLPLKHLSLLGGYRIANLKPLQGMPLTELVLDNSPVTDLRPLEGMKLRRLMMWSWGGTDLAPLRGMPLEELNVGGNGKAMDLGPLAGAPLDFLCINVSQVADLTPLRGMPLKRLYCSNTRVSDLTPLRDSRIEELMIDGTQVKDISVVSAWPVTWIDFDLELPNWYAVLKDILTLQRIGNQPAATFLEEFNPERWPVRQSAFVNSVGIEFALVPKGKTLRGNGNFDEYLGPKEIEIGNDFYLGRFEVTQEQWQRVMGVNPSYFSRHGPGAEKVNSLTDAQLSRLPVERVSWLDCQLFLQRLNDLESDRDWKYRLPTEAEWTYACQGGPMPADFDRENNFYFDKPTKILLPYKANTKLSGLARTCRVGVYAPNTLGLFDMHGNVFEWCDDLANLPGKRARWIHGGGWTDDAERCKVANVLEPTEPWSYYDLGLRVARVREAR